MGATIDPMVLVRFTGNLARFWDTSDVRVTGASARAVLEAVFAGRPRERGYVLDDQGHLRHHMAVFVDGDQIRDRRGLSDPVAEDSVVDVIQALSGG